MKADILKIGYYDWGTINDCSGWVGIEIVMAWLWRDLCTNVISLLLYLTIAKRVDLKCPHHKKQTENQLKKAYVRWYMY